jgi:hypothetical protein
MMTITDSEGRNDETDAAAYCRSAVQVIRHLEMLLSGSIEYDDIKESGDEADLRVYTPDQ